MEPAATVFIFGLLQIAGAVYAFNDNGVLAKMLGLLFCIAFVGCCLVGAELTYDHIKNKRKD